MSEREGLGPRDGEVLAFAEGYGGLTIPPAAVGRGRPPVAHRFKAGNPGRPKGSRNKLGEQFVAALCADFEAHGTRVIARVREEEPAAYLRVIARIVPSALMLPHEGGLNELSDDELAAYLLAVRASLAAREAAA